MLNHPRSQFIYVEINVLFTIKCFLNTWCGENGNISPGFLPGLNRYPVGTSMGCFTGGRVAGQSRDGRQGRGGEGTSILPSPPVPGM